jgi:peptide/nickel transport system permease protein
MHRYVARRLLTMIPTAILVSLLVFGMVRFLPADIVDIMAEEYRNTQAAENLRSRLGLDRPAHVQYFEWVGGLFTGDFGTSLWTNEAVITELAWRWPVTVELALLATMINLAIGVPVGLIAAVRQDSWTDYLTRSVGVLALAIPGFWLGTLVITLPSVWFNWTPPLTYTPFTEDPLKNLGGFIIPALVMGFYFQGRTMRLVRGMMLEVMRQDYIRTAWAKGLTERTVLLRHAAKNALIPVVTLVALEVPFLLGGTLIIEEIFSLPGLGSYVLEALQRRDYISIQSITIVFAGIILILNFLVDISYTWLDPRIRYQ